MTFKYFNEILTKYQPTTKAWAHNDFKRSETLQVNIVFNYGLPNESKVFCYHGTYYEVLQKLHIPIIARAQIEQIKNTLEDYKQKHGKTFGEIYGILCILPKNQIADYSAEIEHYTQLLKEYSTLEVIDC